MNARAEDSNVIITGCGWVLGDRSGGAAELDQAADTIQGIMGGDAACARVADAVRDAGAALNAEVKSDKGAWMTAVAIEHALSQAGLPRAAIVPERTGLVIGSALAGQLGMIEFAGEVREQTPRFVSPLHFPQTVGNFVAGAIARAYDFKGPNLTIASGTASGLDAIIEACALIEAGELDVVLAGVSEVRTDVLAQAFSDDSAAAVEGAVWLVLERTGTKTGHTVHSWTQGEIVSAKTDSTLGSLSGPLGLAVAASKRLEDKDAEAFSSWAARMGVVAMTSSGFCEITAQGEHEHRSSVTLRRYP